jgi:hypothetical protein
MRTDLLPVDYHDVYFGRLAERPAQQSEAYDAKLRREFGPYANDAIRIAGARVGNCQNLLDYVKLYNDVGVQLRCDMLMQRNVLKMPAHLIGLYEQVRTPLNNSAHAEPQVVAPRARILELQEHLSRMGIWSMSSPVTKNNEPDSETYRLVASKKDCFELPIARPV